MCIIASLDGSFEDSSTGIYDKADSSVALTLMPDQALLGIIMKKILITFVLMCIWHTLSAQSSLLVKDANGKPVGIPVSMDASDYDRITVLSEDGTLISLYAANGRLSFLSLYGYFAHPDCEGPEYSDYYYKSLAPRLIVFTRGPLPNSIAKLPATPPTQEVLIKSSMSPSGCGNWGEGEIRTVVSISDYIVEDPASEYGMRVSEETGEWSFYVPLSLEIIKPDLVSCSGFESCPVSP